MNNDSFKKLGTEEVIWDLNDLYRDIDDPKVQKDIEKCQVWASEIAGRYSGRVGRLKANELLSALKELEELATILGKLSAYAQLNFATHVNDPKAGAFLQQIKESLSLIEKKLVFFELEWTNVADERANNLLFDPVLGHYRHYLQAIRRYRPHLLSQKEEQLLIEISPVRHSSWVELFEKVMAAQRFGKKMRTQEEVLTDLYSPDRDVRKMAAKDFTDGLRSQSHILCHTFNTVLADKMIDDRLRDYPDWISSMNLANELDDATVNSLITAVTDRYDIVQRYYRLKQRLLGLEELFDYDRYAPLPYLPQRIVNWREAREIVLNAYKRFSPKMSSIAERFFEEHWIHAPVLPGKTGGAFAHPVIPQIHPYVLLNYAGNLRDVETLAHELGHAIHQVLAGRQGYFNSSTPLTLAETASVFGEMLVFKDIIKGLEGPEEKLGLIAAKLESIFATVFRQVAMNRFENEIHNRRRTEGELSPDKFSDLWLQTQKAMFGESLTLTDDYGMWWSYISHFVHAPGYVYAYAFGELLVLSLYAMYEREGEGFVPLYLDLLSAGGSDTAYELLKPFGIDLHNSDFWHQGLGLIDKMVEEAEMLGNQQARSA